MNWMIIILFSKITFKNLKNGNLLNWRWSGIFLKIQLYVSTAPLEYKAFYLENTSESSIFKNTTRSSGIANPEKRKISPGRPRTIDEDFL